MGWAGFYQAQAATAALYYGRPALSGWAAVVTSNSFLNCSAVRMSSWEEGTEERGAGASGTRVALGANGTSRAGSSTGSGLAQAYLI